LRATYGSRYKDFPVVFLEALDGRSKPAIVAPPDAKKYGIVEDIWSSAKPAQMARRWRGNA